MSWLTDALAKAKKSFTCKESGSEKQSCPLKKVGLIVVVIRADTREPIPNATVKITGKSGGQQSTEKDGVSIFRKLKAGNYKVEVSLPAKLGNLSKEEFLEPDAGYAKVTKGNATVHITKVKRLASLKVRAYVDIGPGKTFLDNVKFKLMTAGGALVGTEVAREGHRTFKNLRPGDYIVSVEDFGAHKEKYTVPKSTKVSISDNDLECRAELKSKPLSRLEVKVVDDGDSSKLIPGVKINVLETDTNLSEPEKTSGDKAACVYPFLKPGPYKVTITLSEEDMKRYKIVGDSPSQSITFDPGGKTKLEFRLKAVLKVYLKCQFKDPEDAKRVMPEEFPVRLAFSEGDPVNAIIGKDGILYDKKGADAKPYVEVERKRKSFTLEFPTDKPGFIVCEKRPGPSNTEGDGSEAKDEKTQAYIPEGDPYKPNTPLSTQLVKGARAFRCPSGKWSLKNSDWEVLEGDAAPKNYKNAMFIQLDKMETTVGSPDKPLVLTLNPHWQFVKFEYFDRFYGHTTCKDKPITPLPLMLEGYRKPQHDKKDPVADDLGSQSNWTIGKNDKELVQCIPWILRKDENDAELKHPNKDCTLRFKTDEDHRFLKSNKLSREYCKLDDKHPDKHHLPCADRLRYYDMPEEWRSHHYFCRLSDKAEDQDFFEILAEKETKKDKPLIFSLDDIVLTGKDLKPVTWTYAKPEPANTPNDRVALFSHKFKGDSANWSAGQDSPALLDAAERDGGVPPRIQPRTDRTKPGLSPDGLYLHEGKGNRHDYSAVCAPINYIADYPDWTRVVIAQGNVHDVFDKRTTHDANADAKYPVGARAGVRWVESAKAANATGNSVEPRPDLVKHPATDKEPLFATQPLFEQRYQQWYQQVGSGVTWGIGRLDPILLRCCDVENPDDKENQSETASSILFTRVTFDFQAEPDAGKTRKEFADLYSKGVCDRFNGRHAGLGKPTEFIPQENTKKLKIRAFYFSQNHIAAGAHLTYKILANNDPSARQYCGSYDGTGMLKNDDYQPTGAHVVNSFTAAHEHGHFTSQPDDYGERWTWCSGYQLDFINYVPGLPYDDDQNAMMRKNQTVRARNLWFAAEWCRIASDTKLKVKFGNDDVYQISSHPSAPGRNYTSWPAKQLYDQTTTGRSKFDLYLYQLGEDATSKSIYSLGGTVDGVLVLTVKCEWDFVGIRASWTRNAVALIDQHIRGKCNNKFYAKGKINLDGEEKTFNRCLIMIQPRYLLTNYFEDRPTLSTPPTAAEQQALADYRTARNAHNTKVPQARAKCGGPHFKVSVNYHNPVPAPPAPLPPKPPPSWSGNTLTYYIDNNNPSNQVRDTYYKHFREMIGHTAGNGDPEVAKLKPIAALILNESDVIKA